MCARRPWDIARPSTPGHHDCRITPGGVTTSDITIGGGTTGVTTGSVTTWQQCNSGSDSPGSHGMAPWTRIVRVADGASGGCESDSSVMGGATGGVAAGGGAMSGAACGGSTLQPHPRPHPHRRPRPKTFILRHALTFTLALTHTFIHRLTPTRSEHTHPQLTPQCPRAQRRPPAARAHRYNQFVSSTGWVTQCCIVNELRRPTSYTQDSSVQCAGHRSGGACNRIRAQNKRGHTISLFEFCFLDFIIDITCIFV